LSEHQHQRKIFHSNKKTESKVASFISSFHMNGCFNVVFIVNHTNGNVIGPFLKATAGHDVWWERLVTLDLAHTLELGSSGLKRPCRSSNQILPVYS